MTVAEYNQCVHDFADRLFRFVLKNLRDNDEARDIVQETFEKMWIKHETVTYSKARSYLFTTAYHTLIDFTRKAGRTGEWRPELETVQTILQPKHDLQENLEWALSQIPEIQRTTILLRDYEGYSYEEIGKITSLSESQVKVYIYRGRMALRKLIGNPEVLI